MEGVPPSLEVCRHSFRRAMRTAIAADNTDALADALAEALRSAARYPTHAYREARQAQREIGEQVRQLQAAIDASETP